MIAPSTAVTALLLHVEIERREIEAARLTAATERELQHHVLSSTL